MASAWGDSWGDAWGDAWGEQAPGTTQAGYRSLLAPWLGGGVAGVTPGPAVRSLLAPWMGGAAAGAAPTTQAAYKSMLAPWMGGAVLGDELVEPPVDLPPAQAGVASGGPGGQIGLADYLRRLAQSGPADVAAAQLAPAVAAPRRSRQQRQRRQLVAMLITQDDF